jgi:hypothetical protein
MYFLKSIFLVLLLVLSSTVFAYQFREWNGEGEMLLESDGKGEGVRFKLPFDKLPAGKTLRLETVSGKFQLLTIYIETANGQFIEGIVSEKEISYIPNLVVQKMTKNKESWGSKNIYFVITLNGYVESFKNIAAKVKISIGDFPSGKADEGEPSGFWDFVLTLFTIAYVGYFAFMVYRYRSNYDKMIYDRNITNNQITWYGRKWVIIMFFSLLIVAMFIPGMIVKIGNLPRGAHNNIGMLMMMFIFGSIGVMFFKSRNLTQNRCPSCKFYGKTKVIGTSNHTQHTQTTIEKSSSGSKVVGKMRYESYAEHRECPECSHRWLLGRLK